MVLAAAEPHRQGIEFDYSACARRAGAARKRFETIMVNCNPETVSTDYDTSDAVFRPLTWKSAGNRAHRKALGRDRCSTAARTPLKLARDLDGKA